MTLSMAWYAWGERGTQALTARALRGHRKRHGKLKLKQAEIPYKVSTAHTQDATLDPEARQPDT